MVLINLLKITTFEPVTPTSWSKY